MKPLNQYVDEQIFNLFENVNQNSIKISTVLNNLDFEFITDHIDYQIRIFPKEALLNLYLFKRLKGITIYPDLIKYLEKNKEEAYELGFYNNTLNELLLPKKRTLNEFLEKIDNETKKILEHTIEIILKTATQKQILLDIELVKRAVKKRKNEIKNELIEATKLMKKLIYPVIDLHIGKNAKFTTQDLLDVLVHVAQDNDFCNNGAETFRILNPNRDIPSGDTVMYHFNKFRSIEEIQGIYEKIFDLIFNFAKKNYFMLRRRELNIAIDIHKIPYYGKPMDYLTSGKQDRGTMNFFSFLTCCIVVAGRRFTVDVIPVSQLDILENLVDKMIKRVKSKIKIKYAFLDRGFDRISIINVLKNNNVKFIMPKSKITTVKAWFDKSEDCKSRLIKDFEIGTKGNKAVVNLFLVDDKLGIKRAFITNINLPEQLAHFLFKWYGQRWGIETGYRNLSKDFRPRTTSKNYLIRLFYFLFSVCLYNLWVLINVSISINLYGRIPKKPLITAKMFAIVLYRTYLDDKS